eukprot:905692-Prorocentrum_minimum.AAC.3
MPRRRANSFAFEVSGVSWGWSPRRCGASLSDTLLLYKTRAAAPDPRNTIGQRGVQLTDMPPACDNLAHRLMDSLQTLKRTNSGLCMRGGAGGHPPTPIPTSRTSDSPITGSDTPPSNTDVCL